MQPAIRRALQRCGVGPGDRLGLAGGAGGEQDVGGRVGVAGHGTEAGVVTEKLLPTQVAGAGSRRRRFAARQHDGGGSVGLRHLGVQRQSLAVAEHLVLGEDRLGAGDLQANADLFGGEAVGDGYRGAAREDDAEIDGHRLRRHRQVDGDRVAGEVAGIAQPVGDPIGQRTQLAVGKGPRRTALRLVDNRHRVRGRVEAALCNIQSRVREPARCAQVGEVGDGGEGYRKADLQQLRHTAPELGALRHRPGEQLPVRGVSQLLHQGMQIAGAHLLVRGQPGRRGAQRRVPFPVGALVEQLVQLEGSFGGENRARQLPPAALRRRPAGRGGGRGRQQTVHGSQDGRRLLPIHTGSEKFLQR